MNVGELIERLSAFDHGLTVVCSTEDDIAPEDVCASGVYEVVDVYRFDATAKRDEAGRVQFAFERGDGSRELVSVTFTSCY